MKRPFRGLRERGPRERYDAIVVGAGIGGLVTANLLARSGLVVLLVEQHYMVGGYCSTFRRGGFTFDASTHFYPLVGNPATIPGRLLAGLGIATQWVRMDPVDSFHFPDGSRFDVPADFATYRARLDAEFPAERAGLEAFFAAVRGAYLKGLLVYFRGREEELLGPWQDVTVRAALDRYLRDPKLKLLLAADCPHWGSPPCRTSFVFDSMLRLSYFLGNYYPRGGSQAFADALAARLEERGGDVLTSTAVERIELDGDRVAGVVAATIRGPLRGRRRIATSTVVSNADLRQTLGRLLPRGAVPPETRRAVERLRPTFPCFLTHLGLEGVSRDEVAAVQGYYWRGWDPDAVGRDALVCKVFSPTVYEPAVAPPGKQAVILQKVLELDVSALDRAGEAAWEAHKRAIEDEVVAHLARLLPEARIVVRLSATARTARRFTANAAGAMLGWEMSPDQLGRGRPDVDPGVPGLHLVGHWTRPGGGVTPVIVSSMRVAEAILAGRATSGPALGLVGDLPGWSAPR